MMMIHFGKELPVLTSPGIASIIAFRGNTLKIVKDNDEDDLGRCVDIVETQIRRVQGNCSGQVIIQRTHRQTHSQ